MNRADPPAFVPVFADVEGAARRLGDLAVETPLLRADALDGAVGAKVFVKAEALQRTGSFKFRGAYNRLARLTDLERKAGVVAFSSGNHAQGVAEAARRLGCPAVIVMPSDAPAIKADATRALGAEIVSYDRFSESREAIAARIAAERGAIVVPSFDDPLVIAGQGTVGLETARQLAALGLQADDLLCPVSGGGLLAGISLAFEGALPQDPPVVGGARGVRRSCPQPAGPGRRRPRARLQRSGGPQLLRRPSGAQPGQADMADQRTAPHRRGLSER